MGKASNVRTLDDLADDLGVESTDRFADRIDASDTWVWTRREALAEGLSEDEADERAMEAEAEELAKAQHDYQRAVEAAADKVLGVIGLDVIAIDGYRYRVAPKTSWRDAAQKLVEVLNGAGPFYFASTGEFLRSGPYTPRTAVLGHLHWAKTYAEVYGDSSYSPRRIIDRALRY